MIYYISRQLSNFDKVQQATMQDLHAFLKHTDIVGVDLETSGLEFFSDRILLLAIGDAEDQFVINAVDTPIIMLKDYLQDFSRLKILHNSSFDYKFLRKADITLFNTYDTMLAEQVLTNGRGIKTNLEALTYHYFRKERDKSIRKGFVGNNTGVFSESEVIYAAEDVEDLPEMRLRQLKRAKEYEVENTIYLENSSVLAFADIEYNGIKLNIEPWMDLYNEALTDTDTQIKKLDEVILHTPELAGFKSNYQLDLFTPEDDLRKVDINWSSPKQVLKILQTLFPSIKSTEEEEVSKHTHPLTEALLKYKGLVKRTGTYGKDFLEHLYPDGHIRTSIRQILATGRVSSSKPNMQQIPADNRYRNCFIPSREDYVMVSADYSSQELALIAFESQDPVWLEALAKGQDLHSTCAELVYGKEWKNAADDDCAYYQEIEEVQKDRTIVVVAAHGKCKCKGHKRMRNNVKTINFGLAYGMSPPTLAARLGITEKEAETLIDQYFTAFPSIVGYLEFNGNFAKNNGMIRTMPPFNRIRFFKGFRGSATPFGELGSMERKGKNTRIQGSGADMVKYAMIQVRNYIAEKNLPVNIVMQVHDQIDTECHKDYAEQWKQELETLMNEAAKVIVTNGLLKVEAEISPVWKK